MALLSGRRRSLHLDLHLEIFGEDQAWHEATAFAKQLHKFLQSLLERSWSFSCGSATGTVLHELTK